MNCSAPGCVREAEHVGLCNMHYQRMRNRGQLEPVHGNIGRKRPDLAVLQTSHGMSKSPTYRAWMAMHRRCRAKEGNKNFKWYGAKGITVCDRWNKFENFLEDMGEKPTSHTIERSNSLLGYSKDNCKWATSTDQARNTSRNRRITFNGRTMTLIEWSIETGIAHELIRARIDRLGWSVEKSLTKPAHRKGTG